MAFNLENVLQQATDAMERSGGSNYKYSIIYPGPGMTKVKFLFNPASNSLMRLINRHTYEDKKVPCMRTYSKDCPICKAIEDAENARGMDLYTMKSKVRGIAMAQLIDVSDKSSLGQNVKLGDIVLLMFPWTVYKEMNNLILNNKKNKANLNKIMATNTGVPFIINRDETNRYSVQPDPFGTYTTCESEEEFEKLLMGFPALETMVVPDPMTPDMNHQVKEVAAEIQSKYLLSSMNNPGLQSVASQSTTRTESTTQAPVPQDPVASTPVATPASNPNTEESATTDDSQNMTQSGEAPKDCFGKHTGHDQNECIMCEYEIDCLNKSGDGPF